MPRLVVILFIAFLSGNCYSLAPAKIFYITQANIDELGFSIETTSFKRLQNVTFKLPTVVDKYWVPVKTQSILYINGKTKFVNRVALNYPMTDTPSIDVHYHSNVHDVNIGAFYKCIKKSFCIEKERYYSIPSVNEYLKIIKEQTSTSKD